MLDLVQRDRRNALLARIDARLGTQFDEAILLAPGLLPRLLTRLLPRLLTRLLARLLTRLLTRLLPRSLTCPGALQGKNRLPLPIYQTDYVPRIDEVRIFDLRVNPPQFRPAPGLGQEPAGNIPQRVPLLHHMAFRMTGGENGLCLAGSCRQEQEAPDNCSFA